MRSLRIVAVATAAEFVVPVAPARLRDARIPRSTSRSRSRTAPRVFDRVLEHEVDVAIAGRPPDDERIAGQAFLPNELALIAAPDDALAGDARGAAATSSASRVWLMREPRLGHAAARRRVPRRARPAPADADARLERRDQGGGAARARRLAPVARRRRAGAASGHARGDRACAAGCREREWYALHSATVPPRPAVELFLEFAYGPDGAPGVRGRAT